MSKDASIQKECKFFEQLKNELKISNKFYWYQILSFLVATIFVVISFFNSTFVYISGAILLILAVLSFFCKDEYMPFNLVMYFFPFCAVITHNGINIYSLIVSAITIISCIIWFIQILKKENKFNCFRFVIFAITCLYCLVLCLFKFYSFSMCLSIEVGLLFLFSVYNNKEKINFKQATFSLIIGLLISCFIGIFWKTYPRLSNFYHITYALGSLRFSALFPNTNAFALLLLFVLGALFVLYLNKQVKYLFYPVYVLILSFSFATVSKTVFVILLIGIPLFIIFQLVKLKDGKSRLKFLVAIIIATIVAICMQLIDFELITQRILAPLKDMADKSNKPCESVEEIGGEQLLNELTTGRLDLWINSIREIVNDFRGFLFGHQLGSEYSIGGYGSNTLSSPHNSYLQCIYHIGSIGFILILLSIFSDFRKKSLINFNKNAIVFVTIFVLLMGVLDNFSYMAFIFISLLVISLKPISFSGLDVFQKDDQTSIENDKNKDKKEIIPKTIHYIWLGGNSLPPIAEKCIESWKKFCPDYEIKRWDESNLNIDITNYSRTAYDMRKFAFASDVLRFDILNREGGIYLDIDVEIIKNLDKFLENELFCGFESEDYVNPGIILGAKPGHRIIKETLESYKTREFIYDPSNQVTVCNILTEELVKCGMDPHNSYQEHNDFTVYPMEYFCPKSLVDGKIRLTENSHGIHHFAATWVKTSVKIKSKIMQIIKRILGEKLVAKLKSKRTGVNTRKDGDKKRILHLLASNKFSGAENVACQIITNGLGQDYEFAYSSLDGEIAETLSDKGINYIPLKKFSKKELKKVINKFNPDVIHAHDLKAIVTALLATRKIKVVAHIHRNHPGMRKLSARSLIFNYFSKRKNLKHIFWVSDNAFDDYVFSKKISYKSSVLYNIIDSKKYYELAGQAQEKEAFDVVFLGRLTNEKNPTRLVDIISLVQKNLPEIKVAIIGDGDLYNACEQKINELNLNNNIKMFGFMKNAYGILKNSKIFIITSITEGNPMALLEAQCFGLPIVSSELEPIHKLVKNGETGYFFNEDEEAAKKICLLSNNRLIYDEMKLKVLEFSKKYNDIDKFNNSIRDAYLR